MKSLSTFLGGLCTVIATTAATPAPSRASSPPCPSEDPTARAAAHTAMALMSALSPELARDVLSPSLYQLAPSGRGVEFSQLVVGVSADARAALAFAQLDDSVATYMRQGQTLCETSSQGYYRRLSAKALAVAQSAGQPWCGASLATVHAVTSREEGNPFVSRAPPTIGTFDATAERRECSPYFGPSQKNEFLVVSLSSVASGDSVMHTLAMDPIPYAEPGDYYSQNPTVICGTQSNPFHVMNTALYADPDHANQWGQRVANGICRMGSFSTSVVLFNLTKYKWTDPSPPPADPVPCTYDYGSEPCGSF